MNTIMKWAEAMILEQSEAGGKGLVLGYWPNEYNSMSLTKWGVWYGAGYMCIG